MCRRVVWKGLEDLVWSTTSLGCVSEWSGRVLSSSSMVHYRSGMCVGEWSGRVLSSSSMVHYRSGMCVGEWSGSDLEGS